MYHSGLIKYLVSITVVSLVFVSGCASRPTNVVIDPAGVNMQAYQKDLSECQQLSQQVEHKGGRGAVGGAIVGSAVGAIVGNRDTAKKVAGVGAVGGTARGAAATRAERDRVVKNCMRNRGYSVLN